MDNPNSMLGLLGMESTSFLEELTRSDDPSPMLPSVGGLANGSVLSGNNTDSSAITSMDVQQQQRQQMPNSLWGQPSQSNVHYSSQDHSQFGAIKHQQRMVPVGAYPGTMMPAGSGNVQGQPATAAYGYGNMSMNSQQQQQQQQHVSMNPPRQMMGGSQIWGQGSGSVPSDHVATAGQYSGMPPGHPSQQHSGIMTQMQSQVSVSAGRTNGMAPGGQQMYGQYHPDYNMTGNMSGQVAHPVGGSMAGYAESQQPQQQPGIPSGNYCQQQNPPMNSPPPAPNRIAQMSMIAAGGQRMPGGSNAAYQQQQHQYQAMQGNAGPMESSAFMGEHSTVHSVNQTQQFQPYISASGSSNNATASNVLAGQPVDGYPGQYYGQSMYRMQNYTAAVSPSQLMSPVSVQAISSPSRANVARPQQHMQSPTPGGRLAGPGAAAVSGSYRPGIPRQPFSGQSIGIPAQRMMIGDVANARYISPAPAAIMADGNTAPGGPSASSGLVNAGTRYASPGYPMNSMPGGQQQMVSGTGTEMSHVRPVYGIQPQQQQQQQQVNVMEMQDRMRNYQQQQQYQGAYYQPQQSQQAIQSQQQQQSHQMMQQQQQQQVQHQMAMQQQQQQQQQMLMMNSGMSPGQLSQQHVTMMSPNMSSGGAHQGETPVVSVAVQSTTGYVVSNHSPAYPSPTMSRSVRQPAMSDLDSSGSNEMPTLKLPDVHMQYSMPSLAVANAATTMQAVVPTRDDEPLSTPPPPNMPEDSGCTYYSVKASQSASHENTGHVPTNTFDLMNAGTGLEQLVSGSATEDGTVAESDKKPKKKRKRKSDQADGDVSISTEGTESSTPVKRVRKKKSKKETASANASDSSAIAAEASNMLAETNSEVKADSLFQSSVDTTDVGPVDLPLENADIETAEPVLIQHQDVEGDVPIIIVATKPKKVKNSKASKEPKEPKEQKESKEHKEPKEKKPKTPKEPKANKDGKSSRGSKKKAVSQSNVNKVLDTSDDKTVLEPAEDGMEGAEDVLEEEHQSFEVALEKERARPPPRPKLKKKRPLPTFLKNKKKRKSAVSDGSDIEHTPPGSPADESLKRRSSRVTKRQKYLEDVDLSEEDQQTEVDTSLVDTGPVAVAVEEHPTDEDTMIVEKIMSSRIVKRKINLKTGLYIDESKDKAGAGDAKKAAVPAITEVKASETDIVKFDSIEVDKAVKDSNTALNEGEEIKDNNDSSLENEKTAVIKTSTDCKSSEMDELPKLETVEPNTDGHCKQEAVDSKLNSTSSSDPGAAGEEPDEIEEIEVEEFFVKYKNFSYLHCDWRTADELELGDKRVAQKIKRFKQKKSLLPDILSQIDDDEIFNPDYVEVDRVLDMTKSKDPVSGEESVHYLVKWRSLPYDECTWELESDVDKDKIQAFLKVNDLPPESERKHKNRPHVKEWKSLQETPVYKNGNTLREYQLEGLNWLTFCYYNKQNCILADEMGLGKTIQSITFLQSVFSYGIRGPFLVIVPLSTLGNWQREFEAWTDLNVIVYHGSSPSRNMLQQYEMYYKDEKGRRVPEVYRFHALVTTYEVIISDLEQLRMIDWRVAVIDEAHRLKNRNCKLLQGLSCFDVEHRVLLTGTPLQNNVEELYSLLYFLEPKQFTSSEAFMADFGKLESETQVEKLKALLKPMMLRRLKEDVEKSLAPKEETIIEVELTNIQKKYYRAILERNFSFLAKGGTTANLPNLMNTMMELRKCCNHPYLINGAEDQILEELRTGGQAAVDLERMFQTMVHSSGKLVLIDKLLPKLKADGHKVLIFSQMIRVLDIIEDYVIHKKYLYERIDGRIRGNLRQEAIDRFSRADSDRFIFLLCTRAGGLGINLTAADTVIIYDSDWNPQNDLQAQARCHRIGQQKAVKVYRLITRNTYEREMFDRASMKLGLDKAVLQSMGTKELNTSNQLSKKEIEDLLKKGAYGALMEDDTSGNDFCEEDIDHILQRRTQVVQIEAGVKGSTFAKASFSLSTNRNDIDIDDPEFWQKWARKADVDADSLLHNKSNLIIEMPRQRKQVSRYGKQDETVRISDLETSDSEVEEDENNGAIPTGNNNQRNTGMRRRRRGGRDKDFDDVPFTLDNAKEGFSRSDCFSVEKSLLVFGWGRWIDIQRQGHFKRKLETDEIRTISRAMLLFSLQHYEGDDRIKMFIFDLVSPSVDGQEKDYRNHTGLSAPVPRGRKGRRSGKKVEPTTPPKKSQFCEDLSKLDIDPNVILGDAGYRKHLQRHAIKLLLRVRLLYYLKQEVIGLEADKVLSGAPASELNVTMPYVDGELPVYWWDTEADRCMVIGIFRHGYEKYNLIRQDPGLCFLARCGPPDGSALLAEENENDDDMKEDDDDDDQQQTPRRRGGQSKKDMPYANADDVDDIGTPNSSRAPSVAGAVCSDATAVPSAENGKLPFPGISDLNARLRRIVAAYQKNHKKELMRQEQNEKRLMRREQFDNIIKQREEARVVALQKYVLPLPSGAPPQLQCLYPAPHSTMAGGFGGAYNSGMLMISATDRVHWSRREEADFYRVVSTFGVERDWKSLDFHWDKFRALARLDKKRDETLTEYFRAFYQMCMNVCRKTSSEDNAHLVSNIYIEPITEERANRCLARIDLLCKVREQMLHHPLLDERLKLCQPSSDMPEWWICGMHDRDLLIGAAKHGLSRTDYHIQYDPKLTFRQFVRERRGRTARNLNQIPSFSTADQPEIPEASQEVVPNLKQEISAESEKPDKVENGEITSEDLQATDVQNEGQNEDNKDLDSSVIKMDDAESAEVDKPGDKPVEMKTEVDPESKPDAVVADEKPNSLECKDNTLQIEPVKASTVDKDDDDTLSESEACSTKDVSVAKLDTTSQQTPPRQQRNESDKLFTSTRDEIDDDTFDQSAVTSPYPDNVVGDECESSIAEYPMQRWSNQWPKDRVIFNRLENICLCIERGEWPVAHRYTTPVIPAVDSHSSTPMPGTPTSSTPLPAPAASAECSSGSGSNTIMAVLDRLHEGGPKLPHQQQRRRRRTKAEMEADRMKRMREIIAASMAGSSLDVLSTQNRRTIDDRMGEDDSGTSGSELRRMDGEMMPVIRRRRGRRPKIEKLLEASAIESAIAAANAGNVAAAAALPSLSSGSLVTSMLWPTMTPASFEQCISRLADAAGLSAESRRIFINELTMAAKFDDRSSLLNVGNFSGDSAVPSNKDVGATSHEGHSSTADTQRKTGEASTSLKRSHQMDVEAAITQEYEPRLPSEECRTDLDGELDLSKPNHQRSDDKDASDDDDDDDGDSTRPINLVATGHSTVSAEKQKKRHRQAGTSERDLPSYGTERTRRSHMQRSDSVEHRQRQPLQREPVPPGELSQDHSQYSAGDDDDDVVTRSSRPRHPEHDAVTQWLAEHRNAFDRQSVEDEVQSELELALGQRQRRRPRLDPAKIDINHVCGDENVSVVNRVTGKRITGAKAPPIRYLKEWLLRNPEFDVDPKWGHIVKARANLPEELMSRVLMPSGRGRRSNAAIAAAAAAAQAASVSSSSSPAPPALPQPTADFYSALASLSALTGGSSAAATAGLMGYPGMPYSLGLGALGLSNPLYTASLASLGLLPGMAALSGLDPTIASDVDKDLRDGKGDKAASSKDKEHKNTDDADELGSGPSTSLHPSFPYMYNPLLFNPLFAAAASNFNLPNPFSALGLGVGGSLETGLADDRPTQDQKQQHKSRKKSPVQDKPREHGSSEPSHRDRHGSKSYGESSRTTGGHRDEHPHRQHREEFSRRHRSVAESGAAGDVGQSEPEDLSVLSTKRREATGTLSTSTPEAELDDAVEDLSRKPTAALSPANLPAVTKASSKSSSRQSPSPNSTLNANDVPAAAVTQDRDRDSHVPNKSDSHSRPRSRLIDSIGSKLMAAQRQKVQTDDGSSSVDPLKSAEDNIPSSQTVATGSVEAALADVVECSTVVPPAAVSSLEVNHDSDNNDKTV